MVKQNKKERAYFQDITAQDYILFPDIPSHS